jgi:hypothetical protein
MGHERSPQSWIQEHRADTELDADINGTGLEATRVKEVGKS